MRIVKRVAIVAGLLILAIGGWMAYQLTRPAPEIVVSKETTWLTEPLADDGLPDYAGYLLARAKEGVTPETNGAIPFLRAMWPAELEPGEQQRVVCEEVGMEVPAEEGMDSPLGDIELEAALREWLETRGPRPRLEEIEAGGDDFEFGDEADDEEEVDPLDYVSWAWGQPWTSDEIPPLGKWIDDHATHFELLHEAADRPAFYVPSPTLLLDPKTNLTNMLLPAEQTLNSAVKCLQLRGMRSIAEGELGAAEEDWRAQLRLSRHVNGGLLIGQMVSIGMEGFANELALGMLADPDLDRATAQRIFDVYRELPVRQAIARELDEGERLMLPSIMLTMSGRRVDPMGLDDEFSRLADSRGARGADWNIPLRMSNEWYDRMVDAARTQPYSARDEKFVQITTELQAISGRISGKPTTMAIAAMVSRTSRSETLGEILVSLLLPAADAACEAQDRSNTERELMIVASALAVYRLEHGNYPESLDDLVPDLMQTTPTDIYHGKPLIYRRTDVGGYLLYAIGPNGQDDGGSDENRSILEGYQVELQGLADTFENENILRAWLGRLPAQLLEDDEWPSVVSEVPSGSDDIAIRLPLPRLKLPAPK